MGIGPKPSMTGSGNEKTAESGSRGLQPGPLPPQRVLRELAVEGRALGLAAREVADKP